MAVQGNTQNNNNNSNGNNSNGFFNKYGFALIIAIIGLFTFNIDINSCVGCMTYKDNLDSSESSSNSSSSTETSSSSSSSTETSSSSSSSTETSSSSSSSTETSTFTSEINLTLDHPMAKIELYSSCSGVAYIYKDFLDRHYIGKITDNVQLTGWSISLHASGQTFSFKIYPKQTQNGFCYDTEFISSKTFYDQNKITNQVSAELTENGDLKIMFNFINIPVDLSSTYEIIPGTISIPPKNNIS